MAECERALALSPDYAEAHLNLGTALAQQGRLAEALPHLRKAVEYSPNDANARRNFGPALFMVGNINEAIPQVEQAVRLSRGKHATMLSLLAQLYGKAGRRPDAVRTARQALTVAMQVNNRELVQELNEVIASYGDRESAPKQ